MTRACRRTEGLIDALLDGELDEARSRAVHAHARTCLACAARLDGTRLLVEAAGTLEPIDPPASLWARIDARLGEDAVREADRPRLWWWWQAARRPLLGVGLAGAVAAAALAVGLWARGPSGVAPAASAPGAASDAADEGARPAPPVAPSVAPSVAPPPDLYLQAVQEIERADAEHRRAIAELREVVGAEKARWRPEVARAFDENLGTIDQAVERQRAVARRQPGNPAAQDALHASYRKQIDFLQEALVRGEVEP